MEIEMHKIPVREIVKGFIDNTEGCRAYSGRLNVRPAFQREFVYNDKQRKKVIDSIKKNFPLNVMYWVKVGEDAYEMLDGQQRTISICQYITGEFSFEKRSFKNLPDDEKAQILDYRLMIYICSGGTIKERLDWFDIVNLVGAQLNDQERRNAVFPGAWLTDAKRYFSKKGCPAEKIAADYLKGKSLHQDYLETALKWAADRDKISITEYMDRHAKDPNAAELWLYFKRVIDWVKVTFPTLRRKIMRGQAWGIFYNRYGANLYDAEELERRIVKLIEDEDVKRNAGIYEYLFDGDERHLNIRKFNDKMKRAAYERQKGICPRCNKHFELEEMEGDHIIAWSKGGKTELNNCQMMCKMCNRIKGGK